MLEQLVASELLSEQKPLDKAVKEIVEKIDKAEKTCEKLMIYWPGFNSLWRSYPPDLPTILALLG